MSLRSALLAVLLGVLTAGEGRAGHELSFYPSFYPQEIKVSGLDRAAAAGLLEKKSLHAYVGPDPFATGAAPAHITYAPSFGSYVLLSRERAGGAARRDELDAELREAAGELGEPGLVRDGEERAAHVGHGRYRRPTPGSLAEPAPPPPASTRRPASRRRPSA